MDSDEPINREDQDQPPDPSEASHPPEGVPQATPPPGQFCPHCQQEHPSGMLYCPATGRQLSAVPPMSVPPVQAAPPAPVPAYVPAQYAPQPGYAQPLQYPQQPYSSYYPQRPAKDRNIALVLEILPGLFGILGIGWIYSGKTGTGLAWLIGYLVWVGIAIAAAVLSGALACFCTVPVNLLCVGISAYNLNNYTKSNPQIFNG